MNKKMNNKGFSLVELIIVIAIMAVLVGVLAPQFIKYVEQSRRSNDIATAEEIRQAILADIADGTISNELATATAYDGSDSSTVKASTITGTPAVTGNVVTGADKVFKVKWSATNGTCEVSVGSYVLTTPAGASSYKNYVSH